LKILKKRVCLPITQKRANVEMMERMWKWCAQSATQNWKLLESFDAYTGNFAVQKKQQFTIHLKILNLLMRSSRE
jgi:hypothetical protein